MIVRAVINVILGFSTQSNRNINNPSTNLNLKKNCNKFITKNIISAEIIFFAINLLLFFKIKFGRMYLNKTVLISILLLIFDSVQSIQKFL